LSIFKRPVRLTGMRYMCLIYNPADASGFTPEQRGEIFAAYRAFVEAASAAGVMVDCARLEPRETAKTVRIRAGQQLVTDGPFAETKEWFAGYCTLECASAGEALEWAAKIPGARFGSVEVRPVTEIPAMPV
jgi:hypothetical protein